MTAQSPFNRVVLELKKKSSKVQEFEESALSWPTGSGKTRIVEAAAEILLGSSKALIKVIAPSFSTATRLRS
jgi:hypothetical protein